MATQTTSASDREQRFGEIVFACLNAAERGQRPNREHILAEHPEFAAELTEFLSDLDNVDQLAAPLRSVLGPIVSKDRHDGLVSHVLGDFHILREVGRGGMGVVYEAEQISLGRRVALKVLPFAATMDPKHLQRFHNEARAAASLHHEHIVPVHGVGCERGVHFYAMQFIDGQTIAQLMGAPPSSLVGAGSGGELESTTPFAALNTERGKPKSREMYHRIADLFVDAADALEFAHSSGIVHRDVKPGNLMIDVTGKLWVTDFGLARFGGEGGLTMTGDLLGTLRYMSPEQAMAKHDLMDHRADVYGLGAALYELLTGRPAVGGIDREEILNNIHRAEPTQPRVFDRSIPIELETVTLKALAKDPAERYATARELADDLRRFRRHEPIRARRAGQVEQTIKWAKRRPALTALIGVSVFSVVALAVAGVYYNVLLSAERERVRQNTQDLKSAMADVIRKDADLDRMREDAKNNLARSSLSLAQSSWKEGDAFGTLAALNAVPNDLRHWEWRYQFRQALGGYMTLWDHTNWVVSVVFSPDGRRVIAGAKGWSIRIWDARTGAVERAFQAPAECLAVTSDGKHLACGGEDRAQIWDLETGQILHEFSNIPKKVTAVSFSPDGTRLATTSGAAIQVWDTRTGTTLLRFTAHRNAVSGVVFTPDSKHLATSGYDDETVKIWQSRTGVLLHTLTGHNGQILGVAVSPDGKYIASAGGHDKTIRLWDAATGAIVRVLTGHTNYPVCVAFSPDSTQLASGAADRSVRVWDIASGASRLTLNGHTSWVYAVAFSPDGQRLATVGDFTARIWDARMGGTSPVLAGHTARIEAMDFSPDGCTLASAGQDTTIRMWNTQNGTATKVLTGHSDGVTCLAFSPDGQLLASGSLDRSIRLWDVQTGAIVKTLTYPSGVISCLAFSRDGANLITAGKEHALQIWDLRSGMIASVLEGHTAGVTSLAVSTDGVHFASGSDDSTVRVWNTRTGATVHTMSGHTRGIVNVAFTLDGTRLASGSDDRTIKVWDVQTGKVVHTLTGHTRGGVNVAFDSDGTRLASGSRDNTIRIWDAKSGNLVLTLNAQSGGVRRIVFSPDGSRLFSRGDDHTLRIWDGRNTAIVHTLVGVTQGAKFSPDGREFADCLTDGRFRLWDVESGKEIVGGKPPAWHATAPNSVLSTDRRWRANFNNDESTMLVKPMPPDEFELGYRQAMARLDSAWQWERARECAKLKNWFAVAFHCQQVLKVEPRCIEANSLLLEARKEMAPD